MSNAVNFQTIGTITAPNGRRYKHQLAAPVSLSAAQQKAILKGFNDAVRNGANIQTLTGAGKLGKDLSQEKHWRPYTTLVQAAFDQNGPAPAFRTRLEEDPHAPKADPVAPPQGAGSRNNSPRNLVAPTQRSSEAPSHANGANIPSLLGNSATPNDNLPVRPSHVRLSEQNAPAPRARQPSSLQAKISGSLDVAATLLQQKVEGAWVDQTKRENVISNILFQPLKIADSWGMGTAAVVNILPGALFALGGGLGRIAANVIAAVARIGVFAIVAVAGYALELCIGAIMLGIALAWWSLEALAVVCLGSLDGGVALAMVILAFITRLFLLDILTNKKIEAEHLIGFAGWCHRFFMKCIREIPDVERLFGKTETPPSGSLVVDDEQEQEQDVGGPQAFKRSGSLPNALSDNDEPHQQLVSPPSIHTLQSDLVPSEPAPRLEREEGKRKQNAAPGLLAVAQPDPNSSDLEDL